MGSRRRQSVSGPQAKAQEASPLGNCLNLCPSHNSRGCCSHRICRQCSRSHAACFVLHPPPSQVPREVVLSERGRWVWIPFWPWPWGLCWGAQRAVEARKPSLQEGGSDSGKARGCRNQYQKQPSPVLVPRADNSPAPHVRSSKRVPSLCLLMEACSDSPLSALMWGS